MKVLGYSLTWRTHCFLDEGCDQTGLFAHTNGDGDFVLFDSLGWPWPVHECYARRFDLDPGAAVLHVHGSKGVGAGGTFERTWTAITQVAADVDRHRRPFSVVGTVTNVELRFLSRTPESEI